MLSLSMICEKFDYKFLPPLMSCQCNFDEITKSLSVVIYLEPREIKLLKNIFMTQKFQFISEPGKNTLTFYFSVLIKIY